MSCTLPFLAPSEILVDPRIAPYVRFGAVLRVWPSGRGCYVLGRAVFRGSEGMRREELC